MNGGPPAHALISRNSGAGLPISFFQRSIGGSGRAATAGSGSRGSTVCWCGPEPEDPRGAVAQRRGKVSAVVRQGYVADGEVARLADSNRLPQRAIARIPDPSEAIAADAQQRTAVGAEGQMID